MGSGGGLRAMRRNITSVSDALAFLVGGDIARAHAASISLIEIAASAVAKASLGSAPHSPVRKRATLPTDPQQAAADASTVEGTAVEGGSPPALVDAAQSGAADAVMSAHGGASAHGASELRRVEILPVTWDTGVRSDRAAQEAVRTLSRITLSSTPLIRQFANEVLADVPATDDL